MAPGSVSVAVKEPRWYRLAGFPEWRVDRLHLNYWEVYSHWHMPKYQKYKRPPRLKYHLDPHVSAYGENIAGLGNGVTEIDRMLLYRERQPCLSKKQSHWPRSYRYKRPRRLKYHLDPHGKRLRREYCRTGKRRYRNDRCCFIWSDNLV